MANSDEYVKITLSNAGVITKDPTTGADIIDKGQLANLERHFKMLERAIMSATNNTAFFSESMKKINEATGQAFKSFYIKKSDYDNVEQALKKADEQIWGKGKNARTYLADMDKEDVQLLTFKRKRAGRIAQSLAEEAVKEELSGKAYFSSAKDRKNERMSFTIPVTDAEINALGGIEEAKKHYSKKLNEELKLSTKYSSLESKNRKEVEEEKQRNEAEKHIKERERKEAKEKKEASADRRKALHWITAITAIITAIANICRRILSATLQNASQMEKESVTAHALGMPRSEYRRNRYISVSHGLDEDTINKAIEDLQSKFGDVTNLDEKSLAILARVMGTEVADAVRSGMGGKTPDQLYERILDKFFINYINGKNSLGQDVGQAQAMRELTTVLREVSPDLALVFARMADEYSHGINAGNFSNYAGFSSLIYLPQLSRNDSHRLSELGQVVDQLNAKFTALKDKYLADLMLSLEGLINKVNNWDIGLTETQKLEKAGDYRQLNVNARNKMRQLAKVEEVALAEDINWKDVTRNTYGFFGNVTGTEQIYKDAEDFNKNFYKDVTSSEFSEGGARARDFVKWMQKNHPERYQALRRYFAYKEAEAKAQAQLDTASPKWYATNFTQSKLIERASTGENIPFVFNYTQDEEITKASYQEAWNSWVKSRFNEGKVDFRQLQEEKERGAIPLGDKQSYEDLVYAMLSLVPKDKERNKFRSSILKQSISGDDYVDNYAKMQELYEFLIKSGISEATIAEMWGEKSKHGSWSTAFGTDVSKAMAEMREGKYQSNTEFSYYIGQAIADALARGYKLSSGKVKATSERGKGVTVTLQLIDANNKKIAKPVNFNVDVDNPSSYETEVDAPGLNRAFSNAMGM